jgi:[ribosomal protein S5]-alanine N-acetyltransferase
VAELEQLRADHADAVLAFERENRAYFAASISDRGDEYFERFAERHQATLTEQETGVCAYYVLVDEDGAVLGRFNLFDLAEGSADLGYRVAQRAAGRGVATAAVLELCRRAPAEHGLRSLRAGTSAENVASQRVLEKAGFTQDGEMALGDSGKRGPRYIRDL